jgi:anti-sigma factor RsiW
MSHRFNRHTCEEAFRRLDDFLDRRLTPEETRLVEEHLKVCAACTREFAFESSVLKTVRRKLRQLEAGEQSSVSAAAAAPSGTLAQLQWARCLDLRALISPGSNPSPSRSSSESSFSECRRLGISIDEGFK